MVEYLIGSPYVDNLLADRWTVDGDGMLAVPDAPGLGVEMNMDAVEKYTAKGAFAHADH
jgi:D-galactarolactone cycloisomerase